MIIIKRLMCDAPSLVRLFIGGGKPFLQISVDNTKAFNVLIRGSDSIF